MITWSVWVSIQVRNLTRSAWLWPGWSHASANAHPAYRGGVQVPCVRHPLALLCATSTTTSTSRWDENAPATPRPGPGPAAFANAYGLLTMRSEGPTASTSPLSRGLCRAHRWVHSRDQIPGYSARLSVRVLEHVMILLSPGSQVGEPFGEEPPGVWGSLDGYLPWETALREPSRLVQTGSRHTSHRGGHWFDPSIAHHRKTRSLVRPHPRDEAFLLLWGAGRPPAGAMASSSRVVGNGRKYAGFRGIHRTGTAFDLYKPRRGNADVPAGSNPTNPERGGRRSRA